MTISGQCLCGTMTHEPQVLFLDNHLLVLGKPAGFLSQEDHTGDLDIITWSKEFLKREFQKPGKVFAGLVHRLDRPASGVIVVARNSKSAARLTRQFVARTPEKRYLAIVEGQLQGQNRLVHSILKKDKVSQIVSDSHPHGKRAVLNYRVLGCQNGLSLVDIDLETGRSHQIRLQFSKIGHPLLGDVRYGSQQEWDGRNLTLHAYSLTLEHPVKKEKMTFIWTKPLQDWGGVFSNLELFFPGLLRSPFSEVVWPKSI